MSSYTDGYQGRRPIDREEMVRLAALNFG
ncbi:hypothetical protein CCACVL1_08794 [Corchorus capsularis]|uniref:Uncharacterized protein n=1 Tax=Corchorus capsularis TaxID=210143 RepID=A0A1R3IYS4_COCAP|nr:hypothetical protein CCACVL1_08794 [Corchorus capsularis]